jgi:hypothetical protein
MIFLSTTLPPSMVSIVRPCPTFSPHPPSPAFPPYPLREASLDGVEVWWQGPPPSRHISCRSVINNVQSYAVDSLAHQRMRSPHGADGPAHLAGAIKGGRQMSASREVHARMETIGLDVMTLTIFINEDSLAAIERQLDALERLIARYGAQAFFGEPDTETPRQTA